MNAIIIHGCPDTSSDQAYTKHWMPWAKAQLEARGIAVTTPLMPTPWEPNYDRFKAAFEEQCTVTEDTILIGHSCGCAFLVRWLGETKQRAKQLILVAPWNIPDTGDAGREAFYTYPIDETIKNRVGSIIIFTADNEEPDGKKSARLFHATLDGKVIELPGRGHYTMGDMGTDAFPELIQEIK